MGEGAVRDNLEELAAVRRDTETNLKSELLHAVMEIVSDSEILAIEEFSISLAEPTLARPYGEPPNDPNCRRLRLDITYLRSAR